MGVIVGVIVGAIAGTRLGGLDGAFVDGAAVGTFEGVDGI